MRPRHVVLTVASCTAALTVSLVAPAAGAPGVAAAARVPTVTPAAKLWVPNPAAGGFSLTATVTGTDPTSKATLTIKGAGFKGLYEAYTWPENLGWQPVKGNPAASITVTYRSSWERDGYYDCQRAGEDVTVSATKALKLVRSSYVDGFRFGGPTVSGSLFARKWKVTNRAFQLSITATVPVTVRRWSEDIAEGGGCTVVEDQYNGTSNQELSLYVFGRLGADNKTVRFTSFEAAGIQSFPNEYVLDKMPASGTVTFKRDLRYRR